MYEPRVLAMLPDVINGMTQEELLKELNAHVKKLKALEYKGMHFNYLTPRSAFEALENTFLRCERMTCMPWRIQNQVSAGTNIIEQNIIINIIVIIIIFPRNEQDISHKV